MNDSISKMTDMELKEEIIALWSAVYESDCYGSRDLLKLEVAEAELSKRGCSIEVIKQVRIEKDDS